MRSLAAVLLASALAWPATTKAGVPCDDRVVHDYALKRDMPAGASAALGFDMAEKDEPFQVTDVIMDKSLPFRRFESARQIGCELVVNFEHGGRGYWHDRAVLTFADGRWSMDRP